MEYRESSICRKWGEMSLVIYACVLSVMESSLHSTVTYFKLQKKTKLHTEYGLKEQNFQSSLALLLIRGVIKN